MDQVAAPEVRSGGLVLRINDQMCIPLRSLTILLKATTMKLSKQAWTILGMLK